MIQEQTRPKKVKLVTGFIMVFYARPMWSSGDANGRGYEVVAQHNDELKWLKTYDPSLALQGTHYVEFYGGKEYPSIRKAG